MARVALAVATAFVLLAADVATAATPKDLVEYRQDVMSSLGGHVGAAGKIVRGLVGYDQILAQAQAIADTAPLVAAIFPQDSKPGDYAKTDALPKIWEQPDDFQKKVGALQDASKGFLAAAQSGDQGKVQSAFRTLGQACGGCHKEYRKKKQQ